MKKLMAVITVLLFISRLHRSTERRTVVQNAADSTQRNFKLQQLEYGLSLKDSLILK